VARTIFANFSKQLLKVIVAIFVITALPFVMLISSGHLQYVDVWVGYFFPIKFVIFEIGNLMLATIEIISLLFALLAILAAISFLFKFEIRSGGFNSNNAGRFEKFIFTYVFATDKKRPWQILAGYFLLLILLLPTFGLGVQSLHPTFTPPSSLGYNDLLVSYGVLTYSIPLLTAVIFFARILSRLSVNIIESNIGVFIIAVFIAQLIFNVASRPEQLPFDIIDGLAIPSFDTKYVQGDFEIYFLCICAAVVGTVVDYFVFRTFWSRWL